MPILWKIKIFLLITLSENSEILNTLIQNLDIEKLCFKQQELLITYSVNSEFL